MIDNIFQDRTIAEYLQMEDKSLIDVILQNVKPKNTIAVKYQSKYYKQQPRINDLFEIEWKWIIKIKQNMQQPTLMAVFEILKGIFSINETQFYNASVFDVFAAFAWVTEEMQVVFEAERLKLHSKPTQKQISAGIEEFDQLDDVPAIDSMAGGDLEKWDEVLEMPYGKIMRKMLLNKIQNEYNERYMKLK